MKKVLTGFFWAFLMPIVAAAQGTENTNQQPNLPSQAVASTVPSAPSKPDAFAALAEEYGEKIQPLMKQFCLECHSTEKQEGELDLEQFSKFEDVRHGTKAWLKVVEMLGNGEMPPKESKQLSGEQRTQILGWVERYLHAEALAQAGDPGPVVLRRLNNAEYTYTIRDLTGVPLSPAKEFPTDSAAGEGFSNTGNSLVMSPALLTKYMDAGKEIASHAVLLPNGFRFPLTRRGVIGPRKFFRRFAAFIVSTPTPAGPRPSRNKGSR